MKIRDLESELKQAQKINGASLKNEVSDGHESAEFLRAKQDMVNRIIQMEEKTREAALISDFRAVTAKLNSLEKLDLVRNALKALENENAGHGESNGQEKLDSGDERKRFDSAGHESDYLKRNGSLGDAASIRESDLQQKIEELQEENKRLNTSVEELDQYHNESMNELLSLKDQLEQKHTRLQNAYEQLYVECNESREKLARLEEKLDTSDSQKPIQIEASTQSMETIVLQNEDREVQTDDPKDEENLTKETNVDVLDELNRKVKDILKNCCIDVEDPAESIFEALARQYVELKWQKDAVVLAWKEAELEKDDMELHIDSLMQQIQELRSNLPSIPEASEERVASLESETESLHEEIKGLRKDNEEMREECSRLRNAVQEFEETSRSPTKMETEIGDEKLQVLDATEQQVDSTSGELKNSDDLVQDLSSRLQASLSENKDLQQRIDSLEILKVQNEEELAHVRGEVSDLEKCKQVLEDTLREAGAKLNCKELAVSVLNQEKKDLQQELNLTQQESADKMKHLNVRMAVLDEECDELKKIVATKEKELDDVKTARYEIEEQYQTLQLEFSELSQKVNAIEEENKLLLKEIEIREDEKHELKLKDIDDEKLSSLEDECKQLRSEVESLRSKENELKILQESFVRVTDQNTQLKTTLQKLQDDCRDFEGKITSLETERTELLSNVNQNTHEQSTILEEKMREIDALRNENSILMNDVTDMQRKLQKAMEGNKESADMAKQTIESLSHLVKERDEEINTLKSNINDMKSKVESDEFTKLQNERDELVKLVTHKHNESLQYHAEIQRLTQLLSEQSSHINNLLLKQNENTSLLEQKEAELLWTRNELEVLQQRLKNLEDAQTGAETCSIVEHSTQAVELTILTEKCNALEAALVQEQSNTRMLQNQLNESQSKETVAAKELERLRAHLVEMESNYTEEALIAEDMRKQLEAKLQQAEDKIKNSSTAYTSASIRANQQVETLQQQMALIIQQRDDIQNKLSAAEDKILSQTASLTNLQIVLEQFQRDKERDLLLGTERIQARLNESYKKQEELVNEITNLKDQLAEAKECLLAASRLSEQLDKKSERIEQLTQEVDRLTELVNSSDQRIEQARQNEEGKVDKALIKNLFLGYLSSSAADKSSVLRVFATLLDFNESEREKAGLNGRGGSNSWFSRISGGPTPPTKDQEASLSAAFVRFLESESKPKPQLPGLPLHTSPLPRPGHSRQPSTSSTQSTLLLSNVNLPTFPDFVSARNTGSILKEVLKDS